MNDLLRQIAGADLGTRVRDALHFLETADPWLLAVLLAILVFLGARMAGGQRAIQSWGLRLAAAAFLLHGGYSWLNAGPGDNTRQLSAIALRSGCVAAAVLAVTWIVLPVLWFVYRHLRLALAAFLGYGGYVVVTAGGFAVEQLHALAVGGLIAAGLALLVAWIIEPIWRYFAENLLPRRTPRPPSSEDPAPAPRSDAGAVLWLRRPRASMLASPEVRARELPEEREAQRRREQARAELELAYVESAPAVAAWFTRKAFDDFVQRHLGDHLAPADVEERARQLEAILRQHQEQSHNRGDFDSLEELAQWLLNEQQRILALSGDHPLKQTQMLELHQRYLMLATRMVHRQASLTCA